MRVLRQVPLALPPSHESPASQPSLDSTPPFVQRCSLRRCAGSGPHSSSLAAFFFLPPLPPFSPFSLSTLYTTHRRTCSSPLAGRRSPHDSSAQPQLYRSSSEHGSVQPMSLSSFPLGSSSKAKAWPSTPTCAMAKYFLPDCTANSRAIATDVP